MVSRVTAMQPTLVREPFHRPGSVYDEKYDGWRMLAFKDGDRVRLVSRNGVDHTQRFHNIASAVYRLPADHLLLDGEVCAGIRTSSRNSPPRPALRGPRHPAGADGVRLPQQRL